MALFIQKLGYNHCCRILGFYRRHLLLLSTSAESKDQSDNEVTLEPNDDSENVEVLTDISRMPKRYHDRLTHVLNAPEPSDYYTNMHITLSQKRKLYGHFGKKSGIDPGRLWPSAEELKETIEFESEWEPNLQERWKKLEETKNSEIAERKEKLQLVESQMHKMPQLIQQYKQHLSKEEEQERQLELKRKVLLDEACEYFGYNIDPRDPRFEQMKEKKEEEEKKLKKKKRKEEKMAKFMASLK